jgi:hypothetical protein
MYERRSLSSRAADPKTGCYRSSLPILRNRLPGSGPLLPNWQMLRLPLRAVTTIGGSVSVAHL